MHINMKYYIVTISAIFIALGIGVLIGFNLNSDGIFNKQQTQIIEELEGRFANIKGENETLEKQIVHLTKNNENLNKYIENTYDYVIDNKLLGKNIGIIQTTEDYFYPNVKEFIYKAKGNVVFEILIKDKVVDNIDLNLLGQELNIPLKDKQELVKYICKVIYEDKNADLLNKLNEKGLIEIKGSNLNYDKLDALVLEGGSIEKNEERVNIIDSNIIDYFKNNNVNLIGSERTDTQSTYIPFYKQSKISTIDNLDEAMGKISLIMVLEGKIGHFGIKETAEAFMPLEVK